MIAAGLYRWVVITPAGRSKVMLYGRAHRQLERLESKGIPVSLEEVSLRAKTYREPRVLLCCCSSGRPCTVHFWDLVRELAGLPPAKWVGGEP